MNAKRARPLLLLLLGASLLWAQKVKVGFDKSADFGQFKTYAWMPRTTPPAIPLLATKIQLEVDYALKEKGLQKVDHDPDLLVSYQGGVDTQTSAAAHDPGFATTGGIPPPNATMWGGSLSAGSVAQVMKGTLAVILVDARQKQTVWSGTAKAKIDYEHQSKMFDQVGKAITEMFKQYPPSQGKSSGDR